MIYILSNPRQRCSAEEAEAMHLYRYDHITQDNWSTYTMRLFVTSNAAFQVARPWRPHVAVEGHVKATRDAGLQQTY